MRIQIINGPNLNLLGKRQPEIYGATSFETYLNHLRSKYMAHDIQYFQSNHEGAIIDAIQDLMHVAVQGLIINPAAYAHTSIAIADAMAILDIPIIEVHISNIHERESFRHHTFSSAVATETIIGKGLDGYELALQRIIEIQK